MKLVAYHVWAPSYEILMHGGGVCVCVSQVIQFTLTLLWLKPKFQ
jgi:hypothetical protein